MVDSIIIRKIEIEDWAKVWQIIAPVIRQGQTFAFDCNMGEQQAKRIWVDNCLETYIAISNTGEILGTFYLKANFAGYADHICNCGYIVAENAESQGVAEKMCIKSQQVGLELGFRAMQFNFVISSNRAAIGLWQRLGFDIVGTLPQAFRHPQKGLVDAYIMFKSLI